MKNLFVYIILISLLCMFFSCEDNKEEYLENYGTILYFLESGEVDLNIYNTGEHTTFRTTVVKAGYHELAQAEVTIEVLDAGQLAVYNTENDTEYVLLPANCNNLPEQTSLSFAGNDSYKWFEVELKTEEIANLPEEGEYVVALYMASADSVNSDKNMVFIKPVVLTPTIGLLESGFSQNLVYDNSSGNITLQMTLTVPFENRWDFECTLAIDEELLAEYNESSLIYYSLLPSHAYTLSNNGVVAFRPGENAQTLDITIERSGLDYNNYILPVRLVRCSKESFEIDPAGNTSLFAISYVPDESKLQKLNLTAGMLSTNAQESSEGPLANLLDNDLSTYFHSRWSNGAVSDDGGGHYVQVTLDEFCSAIKFQYSTRSTNGAAAPVEIIVSGSSDGVNFRNMAVINEDLPTGGAEYYTSAVIIGAEPCNIFRFTVTENASGSKYFVWSTFSLWGL